MRPRRRTGGDPVVHHERGPPGERDRWLVRSEGAYPVGELEPLALLDRPELDGRHLSCPDGGGVDDAHAVLTDGSHGEFRLERHAQLTDDQDV